MNIYEARELQKKLFKRGQTLHKYMMCSVLGSVLCYHVVTRISNKDYRILSIELLDSLRQSTEIKDVRTIIFYAGERFHRGYPPGMYLSEIIKID